MANVIIGTVTCKNNPREMTLIRPDKPSAVKQTYSGVAYFSWPATIVGKELELTWDHMAGDDFAAIDAIFVADEPFTFNPNDGKGKQFTVNMLSLDGKYLIGLDDSANSTREEVRMTLLVMSMEDVPA